MGDQARAGGEQARERGTLRLGKPLPPAAVAAIARVSGADLATAKPPPEAKPAAAKPLPKAANPVEPATRGPGPTPAETAAIEAQRLAWRVADLAHCRERFPVLFDPDHPLPLAIGIHKELGKVLGMKRAMRLLEWWAREWRPYVAAIAAGGRRYNLDGSEADEVTEAARADAVWRLTRNWMNATEELQSQPIDEAA